MTNIWADKRSWNDGMTESLGSRERSAGLRVTSKWTLVGGLMVQAHAMALSELGYE